MTKFAERTEMILYKYSILSQKRVHSDDSEFYRVMLESELLSLSGSGCFEQVTPVYGDVCKYIFKARRVQLQ